MSKNDLTAVRAPKLKTSVIATKRTTGRLAKLKTSRWYEDAARSVGIKKGRPAGKSARGEGSQLAHARFGSSLARIAYALSRVCFTGNSGPEPVVFCCAFGLRSTPNRHKAVGAVRRTPRSVKTARLRCDFLSVRQPSHGRATCLSLSDDGN
jgi:hypothetical protein